MRTFRGGVHPHDHKELAREAAIEPVPLPERLVVSMNQQLGAPAKAVVEPGAEVLRGELLGEAGGFVSAPVHAPTSGRVVDVAPHPHPVAGSAPAVVIEPDGRDAWAEGCDRDSGERLDAVEPGEIVARIREAGVVGMGGATFPTHVKLSPPKDKSIEVVILNGCECEPYLTADHRLMLERTAEVVSGLRLLVKAVGASRGVIGVEANKPDAAQALSGLAAEFGFPVEVLRVKYPQGAEKQLIKALTGREVPSGGLPMDVGCLVQNVGTAVAAHEAVLRARPVTERVCTVTGRGAARPGNYLVRVGMPMAHLLAHAGVRGGVRRLVLGGPMMGLAQWTADVPVLKGTSGVLALMDAPEWKTRACISCGRCVEGCPSYLVPSRLSILAEAGAFSEMIDEANALDCIECGVCTYVCPARRPIVHWVKLCKGELARMRAEAQARQAS